MDVQVDRELFYRDLGSRQQVDGIELEGNAGLHASGQELEPGQAFSLVDNFCKVLPLRGAKGFHEINFQTLQF